MSLNLPPRAVFFSFFRSSIFPLFIYFLFLSLHLQLLSVSLHFLFYFLFFLQSFLPFLSFSLSFPSSFSLISLCATSSLITLCWGLITTLSSVLVCIAPSQTREEQPSSLPYASPLVPLPGSRKLNMSSDSKPVNQQGGEAVDAQSRARWRKAESKQTPHKIMKALETLAGWLADHLLQASYC